MERQDKSQKKTISSTIPLTISLMIVSGIVGAGITYAMSPTYHATMYDKTQMGLGSVDRWLDQRYITSMISHHRAAILLAQQARAQSERKEIIDLASEIQTNEPKLIDELYTWNKSWYGDTRTVPDPKKINLSTADKNFDLRFLNALIWHHEEGIRMTTEIRTKSSRKEVLENADAVENFLKTTLVTLKDWRFKWYGVK